MLTLAKSYKTTIEEAVEANYRLSELTGILRRQFWQALFLLFIVCFAACAFISAPITEKLLLFSLLMITFTMTLKLIFPSSTKKQIRKALVAILGTDQPMDCEFSLNDEGITFKKSGQMISFSWKIVTKLNETPTFLELLTSPAGIMSIPKRVFDQQELVVWRDTIISHIQEKPTQDA